MSMSAADFNRSPQEETIKKVAFIRHGVARHNLLDPATGKRPNLEDPKLTDSPLVYRGKQQALEAGEKLKTWWHTTQLGENIELIITSPLTRCIQTTMLGFLPGDVYSCPTVGPPGKEPKIYCTELVREAFGMHYSDKRREKSLLQRHWPNLQFAKEMTENDDAWKPNKRESLRDVYDRVVSFLQELATCQETNIVVVSHGIWIETCFNSFCPEVLNHGRKRVHNCNIFIAEYVSKDGKFLRLQNVQQFH